MSEHFNQLRAALQERYQLEAELGHGGMATVYLAQDLQHGRRVAVKVLHPELAGAVGHDRFLREIRIASDLNHPHILPLLDSGSAQSGYNTLPFYVMPFVEGESLRARLQREGQLPIEEAVKIAHDVATALSYAHSHGVVHRDIKPENILLAGNEAVVADFGIARAIDRAVEAEVITSAGLAVGTPAYMSPEQGGGHQELDGRSDIYSLGCVLYEMLGGDPPFTGPNANAILARHRVDPVLPLRTIRPSVPASLETVVLQALEKVPADRFKTAYLFATALGQQHTPSGRTPSDIVASGSSPSQGVRTVETPVPRWRSQRRLLTTAGATTLMTVLILLAWWIITKVRAFSPDYQYSDTPRWSAWGKWNGEFFPVFAFTDSLLIIRTQGNPNPQAFDGERWRELTVPDSFALLRYVGPLEAHRLLATREFTDSAGSPHVQYRWMAVSDTGLTPAEPVGASLPDDQVRPHWWSDGQELVLWQATILRAEDQGWVREATGTTSGYADLWGIDLQHRFAIPSSRDSLLVFDGISWKALDILGPNPSAKPVYRAGHSFRDGATVVLGDECMAEDRCRPVVIQQDSFSGPWNRVVIPQSVGIPVGFPADTAAPCSINRLSLVSVAGRGRDDYLIWGSWSSCDPGAEGEEITGCPPEQPCVWRVHEGRVQPIEDLRGRVVQAVGYMNAGAFALLDDGTVWRQVDESWRAVSQVPGLPVRLIGTSAHLVVRLAGDLRYEPGQASGDAPFIVKQIDSLPASVSAGRLPRRLVVRDTSTALLTAEGEVYLSQCRVARVPPPGRTTGPPEGTLLCPPWRRMPAVQGRILDIAFLPTGELIGVGSGGLIVRWLDGKASIEEAPPAAGEESLWGVAVSSQGRTLAIGARVVLQRDSTRRWSLVRRIPEVRNQSAQFLPLAGDDFIILERSVQVWDRGDSLPVSVLYRPGLADASIGALHVLADGRLIAGLANPEEPLVGGRLMVWAAPARANRSQNVELPMSVDITDLDDDGRYLHVVGRGGTLKIPLDSLPFASPRPN